MSGKGKQRGADIKQEDILQAVVIADTFNVRFAPITEKKPRTLLPVVNVPMLDYTLEFLAAGGIQEIFVFCCHLADQIRTHIRNSKWNDSSSPCTVTPILSEGCLSMGDAMREIEDKSLIRSDFILVYGDIVSNLDLRSTIQEHKRRREKDKNAVMTVIMKKAPPGHCSRCREDDSLVAIDSTNDRILHYLKTGNQKKLQLPVEVLTDNKNVQLRYDLLDCQISVCSPQVPALFKDNFDYLSRDDFIKGILMNEEVMGNTIFGKIVRDEYAARISNLQMYDIISRDIMSRWTYPLVPDNSINNHDNSLSYGRHNVYLSKDVTLARGCILEENVVVGSGSSIGCNTVITQSVIGNNCKIGENVKITGSYVWDDVTIEDNCVIETSVICDNVTLYDGVTVNPGSVIAWDVKVGPGVHLPQSCMLQSHPVDDDDDFGDDLPEADQGQQITESSPDYGAKSKAYEYRAPCDSDEEDEELRQDIWGLTLHSDDDISSVDSHKSDEFSDEEEEMQDEISMFYAEMIDQLRRSEEENISNENMILEINSLKHAYNIAIKDLHGMVLKSLIDLPFRQNTDGQQLLVDIKKNLTKHLPLLKNYIKPNSTEPQMDGLMALEEFSLQEPRINTVLVKILHMLYDMDVLEEQVLFRWHKSIPQAEDVPERERLRKQVEPLIKWLQEAEEESSEDE
ncbi:translation initiation factor eIF-2B subunit epsilon-like isoform X2 [Mytilus californianus]|uniref:translation initiation factor eIF-2B subunit epsilon-like isoform X2 n=1 Tax=Mytilus californianus TaxID=6549 RepID=UPI0022451089|nr:translation initiation factor eIF-2B subunit epsilon-like isoform X2 [Mytilus californianus]